MNKGRAILAIAIVSLFVATAAIPAMGINLSRNKSQANDTYRVRLIVVKDGNVHYYENTISESEYNNVADVFDSLDFKSAVEALGKSVEAYHGDNTGSFDDDVRDKASTVVDQVNDALPADAQIDEEDVVDAATAQANGGLAGVIVPSLVVSAGFGTGNLLAFEQPEAFLGFMFAPITINYDFGYTGLLMWPLIRISYKDRAFAHSVQIVGFAGIYLDIGKLGLGQGKAILMVGASLIHGLSA
jgi:hypothetical protein